MSIVNFHRRPDRVLVAVDTIVGTVRGKRLEASKLHAIPHTNLLLAGRGSVDLVNFAAEACAGMADVDAVRRELPARMRRWLLWRLWRPSIFAVLLHPQEVYVFGWSAEREEMAALTFDRAGLSFVLGEEADESIAPDGPGYPASWTTKAMMAMARQQVAGGLASADPAARIIGGRMLVAELTRSTLWIEDRGAIG